MNECADKACQQRVEDTHGIMFKDVEGGVRYDIRCLKRSKMPWKALVWIIPVFLTSLAITSGMIYRAYSGGQSSQDKSIEFNTKRLEKQKDIYDEVKLNQVKIQAQIDSVNEKLQDGKEERKEILEELKKLNSK